MTAALRSTVLAVTLVSGICGCAAEKYEQAGTQAIEIGSTVASHLPKPMLEEAGRIAAAARSAIPAPIAKFSEDAATTVTSHLPQPVAHALTQFEESLVPEVHVQPDDAFTIPKFGPHEYSSGLHGYAGGFHEPAFSSSAIERETLAALEGGSVLVRPQLRTTLAQWRSASHVYAGGAVGTAPIAADAVSVPARTVAFAADGARTTSQPWTLPPGAIVVVPKDAVVTYLSEPPPLPAGTAAKAAGAFFLRAETIGFVRSFVPQALGRAAKIPVVGPFVSVAIGGGGALAHTVRDGVIYDTVKAYACPKIRKACAVLDVDLAHTPAHK